MLEYLVSIEHDTSGYRLEIQFTPNNGDKQYYIRRHSKFCSLQMVKHGLYWFISHMTGFPEDKMTVLEYDNMIYSIMCRIKDLLERGVNDTRLVSWKIPVSSKG